MNYRIEAKPKGSTEDLWLDMGYQFSTDSKARLELCLFRGANPYFNFRAVERVPVTDYIINIKNW